MTHLQPVLIGFGVLAVIGLLASWVHARRVSRRAARQLAKATGQATSVGRTILVGALITGIEWVVVTYVTDWHVLLVVLGLPALFAARTLTRMFMIAQFARGENR